MASKLTDTQTLTGGTLTTGVKNPATLTKFPEAGATFQVAATGATAGSSNTFIVQLRAWVVGVAAPEILAEFELPVPDGIKTGDLFDSIPVFSVWDDWDWNVTQVGTATSVTLSAVGVGV